MAGKMERIQNEVKKLQKKGMEAIHQLKEGRKKIPIFGRALDEFRASELTEGVPLPVYRGIEFLCKEDRLKESGLFRISGVQSEVRKLKELYDRGEDPDLEEMFGPPHTVTGMLKLYFRELPEPLLTYELYDCFIAANSIQFEDRRIECIKTILGFLPAPNYTLLIYLAKFLGLVAERSEFNKMDSSNVAKVFAPNLLHAFQEDATQAFEETPQATQLMQTLIDQFDDLFHESASDVVFDFEYFARGDVPPPPISVTGELDIDKLLMVGRKNATETIVVVDGVILPSDKDKAGNNGSAGGSAPSLPARPSNMPIPPTTSPPIPAAAAPSFQPPTSVVAPPVPARDAKPKPLHPSKVKTTHYPPPPPTSGGGGGSASSSSNMPSGKDRPRSGSHEPSSSGAGRPLPSAGALSPAKAKQLPARPRTSSADDVTASSSASASASASAPSIHQPRAKALPKLPASLSEESISRESPPTSPSAPLFVKRAAEAFNEATTDEASGSGSNSADPLPKRPGGRRSQQMALSDATLRPMSFYQPPVRRPDRSELAQITKRMTMLNTGPAPDILKGAVPVRERQGQFDKGTPLAPKVAYVSVQQRMSMLQLAAAGERKEE